MKTPRRAWIACAALAASMAVLITAPYAALAQSSSSTETAGVPLTQLIESVARKSGKNFIVDPRVAGNAILLGMDPAKITYPQLLTILQVHGFVAIESDALVRIVPDAAGRSSPTPVIGANDKHPDAEIVTRVVKVKSISAPQLVPILRALLPVSAHLAAYPCTNELVIVDSYANVRRLENIIATMDKGEPIPTRPCTDTLPPPPRPRE
ncbi:MAG: secretin N-terminal domain-containing protein [Gemmatimonadaceae bacterium]